jgi:hypothetical protein
MSQIYDDEEADGDGEESNCSHPGRQATNKAVDERQQAADEEPAGKQWLPPKSTIMMPRPIE